jgi:hypothetical protein
VQKAGKALLAVMPGLVPGVRVFSVSSNKKDVDGRDKPDHDEEK